MFAFCKPNSGMVRKINCIRKLINEKTTHSAGDLTLLKTYMNKFLNRLSVIQRFGL